MATKANGKVTKVACPAAFNGPFHYAVYDKANGSWKCYSCGLGGNSKGYEIMSDLEAKLHELTTELDIKRFEQEIALRGVA